MSVQISIGPNAWRTAWHTYYQGMTADLERAELQHVLAALWLVVCVAAGCMLLWRLYRNPEVIRQPYPAGLVLFLLTSAGASVSGPAAVILGGSNGLTAIHDYKWTMHYLHPTFLFPFIAWSLLLGLLPAIRMPRPPARSLALSAAAICLIVPVILYARTPTVPLSEYVPQFVRELDRQAKQYGIGYGIAGYWQARPITLLSRQGLRAFPADSNLMPFMSVANTEWSTQSVDDHSKKPCFNFIVLDDPLIKIPRSLAISLMGTPSREFDVAGLPVLSYGNRGPGQLGPRCLQFPPVGMDRSLSRFASHFSSSVTMVNAEPSQRLNIPIRITNTGSEPWLGIGHYPVTVSYKWLTAGQMLPIEGERTMLPGTVLPGQTVAVSEVVVAPDEPGKYTLRPSLVQEGIAWFISRETSRLDIPAVVERASAPRSQTR